MSSPDILKYQNFYFVGIKGVAMTALAQCLLDTGKSVRGSDLPEHFVTQRILDERQLQIDESLAATLPSETECVIYTSAHNSQDNPQVQAARSAGVPTFTHAEALSQLFNAAEGIAVCGVGGKSTTSAMITWILQKLGYQPNFAIGVGNIPGLEKTGQWSSEAKYFVGEADEYVTDPSAPSRGVEITPRFSFLKPYVTICTNLKHDHPDVYPSFDDTTRHFKRFFSQITPGGFLIANSDDAAVIRSLELGEERSIVWFGEEKQEAQLQPSFLLNPATFSAKDGQTSCTLSASALSQRVEVVLQLPGLYNMRNAAAALAAVSCLGVSLTDAATTLRSFRSTQRRCEFIGEKHGVRYYDDYGHHPHEVASVIHAYREWFPERKLVVGFQSHTFTRTKQFFPEFVEAFAQADEVAMIDIFPSAREAFDASVTSDQLCTAIEQRYPHITARNYKTIPSLTEFCQQKLQPGDVFLTVGAGDIYQVHSFIS